MAIFYRNRPNKHADATELVVAEYLEKLDDNWRIVWGYHFTDSKTSALHEGDFIILGPKGQILVMEVKGGQNRQFVLTGEWEDDHDGDNPLEQLQVEWKAVLSKVQAVSGTDSSPWIGRALCMPNLNLTGEERLIQQFEQNYLVRRQDLEEFEAWWKQNVEPHRNRCPNPVNVFTRALVPGQRPAPAGLFIKETDRILDRYRNLNCKYLEMLEENPRWVVEGGPGTGKTFLAVQRARQIAETGRHVLFLCYNLILSEQIRQLVKKLTLKKGTITVKSWQEVVEDILAIESLEHDPPEGREAKTQYYEEEIPGYLNQILGEKPSSPIYDSLVVDEAQDHDTAFKAPTESFTATVAGKTESSIGGETSTRKEARIGWWSWYFALLKSPSTAPIALFLDQNQRQSFRDPSRFDLPLLRNQLGAHAHFRLTTIRRYTRPIDEYLRNIPEEASKAYRALHIPDSNLPAGPEVIEKSVPREETANAICDILRTWTSQKLCKIDDITILGHRSDLKNSSIGHLENINGYPLVNYSFSDHSFGNLRYLSLHRAKGLDFLGVILIDLPKNKPENAIHLFAGATRARQLLGVVH